MPLASKAALFHGFVVTCDDDGRIPTNAYTIGEPITPELLTPSGQPAEGNVFVNQLPKASQMVAVDALWLVRTINEFTHEVERSNQRIIELLEEKEEKD